MKSLKNNAPSFLLILFEVVIGILLLINPQLFTRAAIICFGIVLLIIGIVYLVRYQKDKKSLGQKNAGTLTIALIALILGFICTFFSWWIIGLFAVVAIFYGIIMILSGIFKISKYYDEKKLGVIGSKTSIASAVLSIILGIIIMFNPFSAINMLWIFIGISLLVEAFLDIVAAIANTKSAPGKHGSAR